MHRRSQPPQQRLLRARGRCEQRGDEQAGDGAAGPAPLRRRRRPPRLPQVPRAPGDGDAAQGLPPRPDARVRQRGAQQAENDRVVRRQQPASAAAVDGGSSSGRSWRRRRRPRGARVPEGAQRPAGGQHYDDVVSSRAVDLRLLAVAVQTKSVCVYGVPGVLLRATVRANPIPTCIYICRAVFVPYMHIRTLRQCKTEDQVIEPLSRMMHRLKLNRCQCNGVDGATHRN